MADYSSIYQFCSAIEEKRLLMPLADYLASGYRLFFSGVLILCAGFLPLLSPFPLHRPSFSVQCMYINPLDRLDMRSSCLKKQY
jgi:hypothetical protein